MAAKFQRVILSTYQVLKRKTKKRNIQKDKKSKCATLAAT